MDHVPWQTWRDSSVLRLLSFIVHSFIQQTPTTCSRGLVPRRTLRGNIVNGTDKEAQWPMGSGGREGAQSHTDLMSK